MTPIRVFLIFISLGVLLFAASSDAQIEINKRIRFRPPRPTNRPNRGRPSFRPGRPRG